MKDRNICKFVNNQLDKNLITSCFIYETKLNHKNLTQTLTSNRMILVVSGSANCQIYNNTYSLTAGCLLFVFAGQTFCFTEHDQFTFMYIDYYGVRAEIVHEKLRIHSGNCFFNNMESLIPIWRECLISADSENIELVSESMLLYAFSKLYKNKPEKEDALQRFLDYMGNNALRPDLTLNKIAEDLGYSPKYLSHFIAKELKVGFSEYLQEIRLRNAVLLMEEGVTSIKNIAILSGYRDSLYFSKVFKKEFGVSPKVYIENKEREKKNALEED